ncbi:MAG TPA: hypothetical protein DCE55_29560, partial [Planctomycetaceae bacterium]|nr:hypothetical protein [Planctomycetaceae bacterium]
GTKEERVHLRVEQAGRPGGQECGWRCRFRGPDVIAVIVENQTAAAPLRRFLDPFPGWVL